ncbi:MAG: NAD-dependent epimerase/dehydratase family protein [Verrucomicrobiota bacterium]
MPPEKTSILVIGLGYVGEPLAKRLHDAGHEIVGITKTPDHATNLDAANDYAALPCDLANRWEIAHLATKITAPANIILCASSGRGGADAYRSVFFEATQSLHHFFPNSRILFTSSSSVYPQTDGSIVTEDSPAMPERETSRILRETEDLILSRNGTVARLAGIYGPSRSVHLKKFLEGTATIEEDETHPTRYLNQIHRNDIVSALSLLVQTPNATGQIYNVTDDTPLTQRACYEFLAAHFNKPLPPVAPADTKRKRAWTHKQITNFKLRSLGWSPQYPSFPDAIQNDPDLVPSIESKT